jgi:hypothetical protein
MINFIGVITAEMLIGLVVYPGQSDTHFSPVDGYVRVNKPVRRLGLGALGSYTSCDIGKRVYNVDGIHQVENVEQVQKRTGKTPKMQDAFGEVSIKQARTRYDGEKNIWGLMIRKPF